MRFLDFLKKVSQKRSPKGGPESQMLFFVFQHGRNCCHEGSPWSSRATSKSIFMNLTSFGNSVGKFLQWRKQYRGRGPRNIMHEQRTTTPSTTKQVGTHTHTHIEPKCGGGDGRSPLDNIFRDCTLKNKWKYDISRLPDPQVNQHVDQISKKKRLC